MIPKMNNAFKAIIQFVFEINFQIIYIKISVILDSDGILCQEANFNIGLTTTTRQWKILVTQYACGQEETVGAPGCLQYHTASVGFISRYFVNTTVT